MTRPRSLLLIFLVGFFTLLFYWPGLSERYVLDDFPNIAHNEGFRSES